jgi:PIN domain nuclease of toxin-antitoxin system
VILLDTQMWVWFHLGDPRLPNDVREAIGPTTCLSAISVWEVMRLLEKGRLQSAWTPQEVVRRWLAANPFRVVPVDTEVAILARTLPFVHEDPADRFIAATAHHLGAALATSDARLRDLPWLNTLG